MKTYSHRSAQASQRASASDQQTARRARPVGGPDNPRALAQRRRIESAFGAPAQRAASQGDLPAKTEPAVQRVGEEEDLLQGRFATVQRAEDEELLQGRFRPVQRMGQEEDEMQMKPVSRAAAQRETDTAPRPNDAGLPVGLKAGIKSLANLSLDSVKVHYNSPQPAQLNALAYAQGTDIHVAPGQEAHLPHEAWHVVQQQQGRVAPTMQMAGVGVNDDPSLEREADLLGARAAANTPVALPAQRRFQAGQPPLTVQLKKVSDDHVGDDLNHPQAARLFSEETIDWWSNLPAAAKANGKAREASVKAGRDNVEYQQLRNTTLKNAQGLRSWLGTEAYEHMYVHENGNIYTGGRDREKLPHPTLVGGDPDATCAGTMWLDNSNKTVAITNESGHFRPPTVASATVELVKSILPKPAKGKAGYKVKKQEV
jgi:Domain of unknown function (DUF4157)